MKTKVKVTKEARVCQGDIIKDVEYIESYEIIGERLLIHRIIYPYVVVLTQDCDLEQEYNVRWGKPSKNKQSEINKKPKPDNVSHDKWLVSILVAPLYNYEQFKQGDHLSELERKMQKLSSTTVEQNKNDRFHYMEFPSNVDLVTSIVDFKHYFSVSTERIKNYKKTNFVCTVGDLYRELLSQRFANYLSRIGLPEPSSRGE